MEATPKNKKWYLIAFAIIGLCVFGMSLPSGGESKEEVDNGLIQFEDADSVMRAEYAEIP